MFGKLPPELIPGAVGSALAAVRAKGSYVWRIVMFVAGSVAAYAAAEPVTLFLELQHRWVGVFGFLIGAFAVSLVAKVLDAIAAIDASEIGGSLVKWVKGKLGL